MTLPATIVIAPEVMTRKVGDETVILHLAQGTYHALDAVGTRIWQLMTRGMTAAQICEILVNEYEVSQAQFESDLQHLLDEMRAQGLVTLA